MKRESPHLTAALLLGLFSNALLCGQTAYWARIGILLAPVSALVLTGLAGAFLPAWRLVGQSRWLRIGWVLLLVWSSALELLRFWQLMEDVYPGTMRLFGVCLMLLAPVIYLRRVSSIAQTANVMLSLLVLAGAVMVLSVAAELRVDNLQTVAWSTRTLGQTFRGQLVLYPEFLLPALWPEHDHRAGRTVFRLACVSLAFSVGTHLLLELFFGAGTPGHTHPVHLAAQAGTLALFARLEWLQLILWAMMVTLKLALYLYAGVRLIGGRTCKGENNAVGLDRFPLYFLLMVFVCALCRSGDLSAMWQTRNNLMAGFAGLVLLGGGITWLGTNRRPQSA